MHLKDLTLGLGDAPTGYRPPQISVEGKISKRKAFKPGRPLRDGGSRDLRHRPVGSHMPELALSSSATNSNTCLPSPPKSMGSNNYGNAAAANNDIPAQHLDSPDHQEQGLKNQMYVCSSKAKLQSRRVMPRPVVEPCLEFSDGAPNKLQSLNPPRTAKNAKRSNSAQDVTLQDVRSFPKMGPDVRGLVGVGSGHRNFSRGLVAPRLVSTKMDLELGAQRTKLSVIELLRQSPEENTLFLSKPPLKPSSGTPSVHTTNPNDNNNRNPHDNKVDVPSKLISGSVGDGLIRRKSPLRPRGSHVVMSQLQFAQPSGSAPSAPIGNGKFSGVPLGSGKLSATPWTAPTVLLSARDSEFLIPGKNGAASFAYGEIRSARTTGEISEKERSKKQLADKTTLKEVDLGIEGFQKRARSCRPRIRSLATTNCIQSDPVDAFVVVPLQTQEEKEKEKPSCANTRVPTMEDGEKGCRSPSVTSCSVRGDSVGSTISNSSSCLSPTFHYKKYRYEQKEPIVKPRNERVRVKKEDPHAADARAEYGSLIECWDFLPLPVHSLREKAGRVPAGGSETAKKNSLPKDIKQVGEVLRHAYNADPKDIVWSLNAVSIMPDGVASDKPDTRSRSICPKTLWLRGGRVYDYFGDLGTISEFISEPTPWQTLRSRRRDLGLQPFPFLPQPLTEKNEDGAILKYQEELKRWTQRRIG